LMASEKEELSSMSKACLERNRVKYSLLLLFSSTISTFSEIIHQLLSKGVF
jgi:hypothetical protein